MPVLREGRMVRHRAIQPEPAKPAVRQVQVNFLTQPPLRADAEAVADDQHPDQQLRIDRGPTFLAVIRRQLLPQPVEPDEPFDRTQKVSLATMVFERKLVKQSVLPDAAFPHHSTSLRPPTTRVNQRPRTRAIPSFSTQSNQKGDLHRDAKQWARRADSSRSRD